MSYWDVRNASKEVTIAKSQLSMQMLARYYNMSLVPSAQAAGSLTSLCAPVSPLPATPWMYKIMLV